MNNKNISTNNKLRSSVRKTATSSNGKCPDMKFSGNDCVLDLEHPAALSSRLRGGEDLEVQDLHGEQFNLFFYCDDCED